MHTGKEQVESVGSGERSDEGDNWKTEKERKRADDVLASKTVGGGQKKGGYEKNGRRKKEVDDFEQRASDAAAGPTRMDEEQMQLLPS